MWLGYGLWTETQILAWERDHPGPSAPAHDFNQAGGGLIVSTGFEVFFFLTVTSTLDRLLARRRRERVLTGKRVPPLLLDAFGLVGLAAVALSIYLGAEGIEHWRHAAHAGAAASAGTKSDESRLTAQCLLLAIGAELFAAALSVWMGANLALKAIGERRFAFYHSTDEERSAVSQASVEEQRLAKRERRQRTILAIVSIPILLLPYGGPWTAQYKVILCLVEAATFAVFFFANKALGTASWRKRILLFPLVGAAFLPQFIHIVPGAVQSGVFFGCMAGMLVGSRYRPLRTVKVSPPAQ
jgi:hypothetical protein